MSTSSVFIIRETTAADAEKLPAVERSAGQAFRSVPELAWIAEDDPQTIRRHLELIESGVSWVAVPAVAASGGSSSADGGGPVGFLNGQLLNGFLHIWEMSVDRKCQGQGIGKQLMQTAIDHATQHRYKGLTLTTFLDVPWNDAFYKSRGFVLLEPAAIPPALLGILDEEARGGLPRERRCAMELALSL
ncbi:GCN5-related N-acetyltransferase (GNAT) domain-containing protein [Cordyceps javanica]|uniref:GCN5-related N-acetyltransferase (GNAT) domain-containing protein n=1 Tax=Cordyceps javanica TaxID=43265 RepID=A0A545VNL4_9HYPO|nr:GCN5-related N-acetyltransferase (GNAT) domain-containing protein [Cordyceps javanica]TQW03319.1 GCN5-related N-acetyltransferase (GNAT) domain protein [Cordyceps javanica]